MKTRYLLLMCLLAITAYKAMAAYERHDGSIYSCNEINAERAYAKAHNQHQKAEQLRQELNKYCPGYDHE